MTILNCSQVQDKIILISKLDASGLRIMASKVSLSDIDDKARSFINRALDLRWAELCDINTVGLEVEHSYCKDGEMD